MVSFLMKKHVKWSNHLLLEIWSQWKCETMRVNMFKRSKIGGKKTYTYMFVGNFFPNVSLIFLRVVWNIYFNRGNLRLHRGVN